MFHHRTISLFFIVLALIAGVASYSHLPEQMPSHWNLHGQVDDTLPRFWGVLIFPLIMSGLFVVNEIFIRFSPEGFRVDEFKPVVGLLINALMGFMLCVDIAQILFSLGVAVQMSKVISMGVGAVFVLIGNYMGKLRKNFFIGIRTPWTLANDEVWWRTHRLGSWLFMGLGIAAIASSFVSGGIRFLAIGTIAVAVFLVGYSLVIYRRLLKERAPGK